MIYLRITMILLLLYWLLFIVFISIYWIRLILKHQKDTDEESQWIMKLPLVEKLEFILFYTLCQCNLKRAKTIEIPKDIERPGFVMRNIYSISYLIMAPIIILIEVIYVGLIHLGIGE